MKSILLLLGAALPATLTLAAAVPASLGDAFAQGKVSLHARLRYEHVDQTALRDADAVTFRPRLGFTTARYLGWQAMLEGEAVLPFDGSTYSQAGLNASGAGRAVVADPKTTEINQAWLSFAHGPTTATLGRQRLVLDNARFVGDVGWRQNQQTFDAFVLQDKSLGKTTLTYAFLDQVNRVFSHQHPQGRWESDSHLAHLSHTGFAAGTLNAYAYLLDFANAATNSTATFGASFAGAHPFSATMKLTYRAEFAAQRDHAANPQNYSARYLALEAGPAWKNFGLALGHERLGSDRNVGFKTPLATLHAFNGWADLFLATPAAGLRDTYVKANATLPQGVALLAFYHWFEADRGGGDFGGELDVQLTRKFGQRITVTAKFADFRRDTVTFADVRKFWLQLDYIY